jgi:hypothetical protein
MGCAPYGTPLSFIDNRMPPALPTDRFLDAKLGDLCALQRRVKRISRSIEQRIFACLNGNVQIDVFSAPILNDTLVQIRQMEALMSTVVHEKRQSLKQAHLSRQQLLSTQGQS